MKGLAGLMRTQPLGGMRGLTTLKAPLPFALSPWALRKAHSKAQSPTSLGA